MQQALVAALLDCVAFLELSGAEAVDPDAAVGQLEAIARVLQALPVNERDAFVATVEELAASEADARRRALFVAMPEALGLRAD